MIRLISINSINSNYLGVIHYTLLHLQKFKFIQK
jgi:hypothetical protein